MDKGKPPCWPCNGSGTVVVFIGSRKIEKSCDSCGGTGEK